MRFDTSPWSLLMAAAAILFLLAAFGVSVGNLALQPLGLAAFAAAFLFGRSGMSLRP